MDVPLQPEKEAQLAQIAAQRGLRPQELVQEVLTSYLEDDRHFVEAVNIGIAPADRGDFIDHEEIGQKLKQLLHP